MKELKFTKKIKQDWLNALKSGNYIQGVGMLKEVIYEPECTTQHCCLGVLAEVHPKLSISKDGYNAIYNGKSAEYDPFYSMLSADITNELYGINDNNPDGKYGNVIPIIEALPTED